MSIIGTLPNTLTNGTTADASQVMADLNYIVNQVNANANPVGTFTAPSGTRMPFQQSSAPTGWTVDTNTALNDCSCRITVPSNFSGTAGSVAWSQWNLGGTFNLNSFTLSTAQLPAHSHPVVDPGHVHVDSGHSHPVPGGFYTGAASAANYGGGGTSFSIAPNTSTGTANIQSATTGITTSNTGTGASITPTITTPSVKFADHVIGIKS